ncbi:MAG: glycosyltransferase family 2 protein, partial [bacterium]
LVSVIIPTHNRGRSLCRALDSVVAQEGSAEQFELEVLVIDDASTDDTPELIRRYPQVRYIPLPQNLGTSGARNVGLKEANGRYVAFLDDDDAWLPWKLRRQVALLDALPDVSVAYGQEIRTCGPDVFVWPDADEALSGWIARPLLTDCPVNTSSVLIRRAALQRAGYFDETLQCWEDYDLWLRLAINEQFRFLPGPAVIYQVSTSGRFLGAAQTGDSERDLRRVVRAGLERLRAKEPLPKAFLDEVEAETTLRIAGQLAMSQQSEAQRAYLLTAVRQAPRLIRMRQLRWMLSHAPLPARGSSRSQLESGLDQIRDFCRELKAAVRGYGPAYWLAARRLEAEVWRTVAVALAAPPHPATTLARRAAVRSLAQHPGTMGRALLHVLVGTPLAPRVNGASIETADRDAAQRPTLTQ